MVQHQAVRDLEKAVGVEDKLLGCSFVESGIALRGVAERKNGGVYDFCNGQAVMQDGLRSKALSFPQKNGPIIWPNRSWQQVVSAELLAA